MGCLQIISAVVVLFGSDQHRAEQVEKLPTYCGSQAGLHVQVVSVRGELGRAGQQLQRTVPTQTGVTQLGLVRQSHAAPVHHQ